MSSDVEVFFSLCLLDICALLVAQTAKNLPAVPETQVRSLDGTSPGEGNGNPVQYSCLRISGVAWWATVRGVTKSQT